MYCLIKNLAVIVTMDITVQEVHTIPSSILFNQVTKQTKITQKMQNVVKLHVKQVLTSGSTASQNV